MPWVGGPATPLRWVVVLKPGVVRVPHGGEVIVYFQDIETLLPGMVLVVLVLVACSALMVGGNVPTRWFTPRSGVLETVAALSWRALCALVAGMLLAGWTALAAYVWVWNALALIGGGCGGETFAVRLDHPEGLIGAAAAFAWAVPTLVIAGWAGWVPLRRLAGGQAVNLGGLLRLVPSLALAAAALCTAGYFALLVLPATVCF